MVKESPKKKAGEPFSRHAHIVVSTDDDESLGSFGELKHKIQTKPPEHVKKFLRTNHWPHDHRIRTALWRELCADADTAGRVAVYHEVADEIGRRRVQLDPACTQSSSTIIADHRLSADGVAALRRVLVAVERQRPDITNMPTLYPLTALCLHYMDEAHAYACVLSMVERGIVMQTDIAVTASRRTLVKLCKKHMDKVHAHLRRAVGGDDDALEAALDDWTAWIFRDLPFEHLVRVIDCLLYEGQKVVFRVALVLLQSYVQDNKRRSAPITKGAALGADIAEFVRTRFADDTPPHKLIKRAFDIRNLSMTTVNKVQRESELVRRHKATDPAAVALHRQNTEAHHARLTAQTTIESSFVDLLDERAWITPTMALALCRWLPRKVTLRYPRLVFDMREHGTSFTELWRRVEKADMTLFVVRTAADVVFAAYCSVAWQERHDAARKTARFFGTGESFVASLGGGGGGGGGDDDDDNSPTKYGWTGDGLPTVDKSQEMYMAATDTELVVGAGGKGGGALQLRGDLSMGYSSRSATFDNPALHGNDDDPQFDVADLLVYAFMEREDDPDPKDMW